jgi:hypothetical protein
LIQLSTESLLGDYKSYVVQLPSFPKSLGSLFLVVCDVAEVPDLSASRDNSDLAEDDPCDPTTTSKLEAPMQSLNQLPVVTDLADARSA